MGSYAKNYMGFKLSPEQMADIPYPLMELMTHISIKTVQAGVIIGTLTGAITAVAKSATRNTVGIEQKIAKFGGRGAVIGVIIGPVLTMAMVKKKNMDNDGLHDRCFRIRNNRGQVRVDRAMDIGIFSGVGLTYLAGRSLVYGGVLGCTVGVLTCAVLNAKGIFDK